MNKLNISICLPAYNEEKNIGKILTALGKQRLTEVSINKIIVVSSGSTDRTDAIVEEHAKTNHHITLMRESQRTGKATAINHFLRVVDDPVIVIQSADTIPAPDTIEQLCKPFLHDDQLGMTGGAPHPTNDPETFLGYIIHAWWWFHRNIPRFGEIIAFRNVLPQVATQTAVDEAFIQAKMVQLGYKVIHVDEAKVYNHGPENVADLIKQRRRIFNGHARLQRDENVRITNMTRSSLNLLLFEFKIKSLKHLFWLMGGIILEFYSRILGAWDTHVLQVNPFTWDTATSTKHVSMALEDVYETEDL